MQTPEIHCNSGLPQGPIESSFSAWSNPWGSSQVHMVMRYYFPAMLADISTESPAQKHWWRQMHLFHVEANRETRGGKGK